MHTRSVPFAHLKIVGSASSTRGGSRLVQKKKRKNQRKKREKKKREKQLDLQERYLVIAVAQNRGACSVPHWESARRVFGTLHELVTRDGITFYSFVWFDNTRYRWP